MNLFENNITLIKEVFFVEKGFYKTNGQSHNWKYISRVILPQEIKAHFNKKYYVGFHIKDNDVDFFIIDLDAHDERTKKNLRHRYDKITKLFGNPHCIFLTPRMGYHLYYLLDKKYPITLIRSRVSQKVRLKLGEIEFFPSNHGLRLFGGLNCPLVNYDLKEWISDSKDILTHFRNVYELSERISLKKIIVDELKVIKNAPAKYAHEVKRLIENGLQEPSSRNSALLKINFYLQAYQNFDKREAENFLIRWISEKHNDFSGEWKKNPNSVKRKIYHIANNFDKTKISTLKYFPVELLEKQQIQRIEKVALEISKHTTMELYKIEAFLQDFFSYCITNSIDGIVEIPSKVMEKCRFGSRGRYIQIKQILIQVGILKQTSNYSVQYNKCRKYKILDELLL